MPRSQPNGYRPPPRLGELGSLPPPDKVGAPGVVRDGRNIWPTATYGKGGTQPICLHHPITNCPRGGRQGRTKAIEVSGRKRSFNVADEVSGKGLELRVCGYGRIPTCPSLTAYSGTGKAICLPSGKPGRGFQPVPGTSAVQGTEASDRHINMDPLFLSLHGCVVQEGTRDGAKHGRPSAYSTPPPAESIQPVGLA